MQVEGGAGPLLDEAERLEGETGVLIHPVDGDDRLAVLIAPAAGGGPMLFLINSLVIFVMIYFFGHLLMKGLVRWMSG